MDILGLPEEPPAPQEDKSDDEKQPEEGLEHEEGDVVPPLLSIPKPAGAGKKRRKKRAKRDSDSGGMAGLMASFQRSAAASTARSSGSGTNDGKSVASASTAGGGKKAPVDPGPVGRRIEELLRFRFNAAHVKVVNFSHWLHLVRVMGNANVRLRKVTCSETSRLWSAAIMTMQMDPETGTKRPALFHLGSTFKTERAALAACDEAAARRDRGPPPPQAAGLQLDDLSLGASTSPSGGSSMMSPSASSRFGAFDDGASVASSATAGTRRTARSSVKGKGKRGGSKGKRGKKKKRKKPSEEFKESHFRVTLVSEAFEGKDHGERLRMVYRVLEEELWIPAPETCETEVESQWKSYSYLGRNIRDLPEWRGHPWHIFVETKTPAQHAALRMARTRTRRGSTVSTASRMSSASGSSKPAGKFAFGLSSGRTPLQAPKGLSVVGPGQMTTEGLSADAAMFLRRSDMDPGFIPATEVKQMTESGVPGSLESMQENIAAAHHDMKLQRATHRARVAAMAKAEEIWNNAGFAVDENGCIIGFDHGGGGEEGEEGGEGEEGAEGKAAAAAAAKKKGKPASHKARLGASALGGSAKIEQKKVPKKKKKKKKPPRDKAAELKAQFAALYGNDSKKERADLAFRRRRRQLTLAAKSLQRVWRMHSVYPVLREMRRQHRSVTTIGRVWRGYVARRFQKELHDIIERTAIMGQCIYRGWVARRIVKKKRVEMNNAAVMIQKICRGHKGRQWWTFVYEKSRSAIIVQKVIRGFIARAEARHRARVKHFHEVVIPSAVRIQAQYRRRLAIKVVAARRAYVYHITVEVPAAIRIQAIWRMHAAVQRKLRLRLERWAATHIQRIARGMGYPARYRAALKLHYETIAADKVTRVVRGWYCRRLLRHRAAHKYREEKMIPAAIEIQRRYKGAAVRKVIGRMKLEKATALRLQAWWRNMRLVWEARVKWREMRKAYIHKLATALQSAYRGFAARRRAKMIRHSRHAADIMAARQVQAWWRARAARKAFVKVLQISKIKIMRDNLNEVRTDCETITEDMEEIRIDVANRLKCRKKYSKQLGELRTWRNTMQGRLPVVEEEMDKLTEEDMVAGWGEAYEREFSYTSEAIGMVKEEILGKKFQIRETDKQVETLRVELDDLETDMDHSLTRELEVTERLRRTEINMCEELWLKEERRAIARQKCRWGLKMVRKKVVKAAYDERRNAAVAAEIEARGGMAAMGIWDNDETEDEIMAKALAHTPTKPKTAQEQSIYAKQEVQQRTPTPPRPTSAQQREEAAASWQQTKKALQFIARTVGSPASRFATDGSQDREISRRQRAAEKEAKRWGKRRAGGVGPEGGMVALPEVEMPAKLRHSTSAPGGMYGMVGSSGGQRKVYTSSTMALRPTSPLRPGSSASTRSRSGRRARPASGRSVSSAVSSAASLSSARTSRSSARAKALARMLSGADSDAAARNAGGYGRESGTALGGVGKFPKNLLFREYEVKQPRGLLVSNTSVSVKKRLKAVKFVQEFRAKLDKDMETQETRKLRRVGAVAPRAFAETFDNVIAGTKALLSELSFDARHPKDDPRGRDDYVHPE